VAEHTATIEWQRGDARFVDNRYSRAHTWSFDGGARVPGWASPHAVRPPRSDPAAVDPEEAFVASLSSCHMLWFLSIAAGKAFCVDRYSDAATGTMARNAAGRMAMTRVVLRPRIAFSGDTRPSAEEIAAMHHEAHEACFIANSVITEVVCEPAS
jgi:organic hydroperoxide reductase OsmC/OhrA